MHWNNIFRLAQAVCVLATAGIVGFKVTITRANMYCGSPRMRAILGRVLMRSGLLEAKVRIFLN
jgi:hypothetical protein